MKKIQVIGAGYVGTAMAVLLAEKNIVSLVDTDQSKVDMLKQKISPIEDSEIEKALLSETINLESINKPKYDDEIDFNIIALPTNFKDEDQGFDTSIIQKVTEKILKETSNSIIIIKSTIPIGFVEELNAKLNTNRVIFSPEFLREGRALYDNQYPSRIIAGGEKKYCLSFLDLIKESTLKKDVETLMCSSTEAEAIKLFSNTYLATRISFFNELDTFCIENKLNAANIINGVCMDQRIGAGYNNPSFGYGGYCLPKDTKQLNSNFANIPQKLIKAVIQSNVERKKYLCNDIDSSSSGTVGIYKLAMKMGSDNIREAAVTDILFCLQQKKVDMIIYEPMISEGVFNDIEVVKSLDEFKKRSNIIICNRRHSELGDVSDKLYSRDIFNEN